MYDINLIRGTLVPESRRRALASVVCLSSLVFLVTIFAIGLFTFSNFKMGEVYAKEVRRFGSEFLSDAPERPSVNDLSRLMNELKPELRQISGIVEGASDATTILSAINGALPDSVWITRLRVAYQGGANHGRQRGGNGRGESAIVIEGAALVGASAGGDMAIRRFARDLGQHGSLAAIISGVECSETGIEMVGDAPVIGFEAVCRLRG